MNRGEYEKEYRDLVENSNAIMLRWIPEGKITFINEFGRNFFGYSERELIGRHVVGSIVPETESTGRHLSPLIEGICSDPRNLEHNINENMRRNGERVWISWTNKIVADEQGRVKEILSIGVDITERRLIEEALRRSEEKVRKIFDDAPLGIFQSTPRGKFLFVNLALAILFGYDSPEQMKLAVTDIANQLFPHPEQRRTLLGKVMRETGYVRQEVDYVRKNGTAFVANVYMRAVRDHRENVAFLEGFVEDITWRKKVEAELQKYQEHLESLVKARTAELERANVRLQELDRLKSMFIASMSHELRTPLNSIIGFTGMTLQGLSGELNPEQKDNLARAYQASKHLLDLISDVIDISKIEAGRVEAFPEAIPLKEIIEEALDEVRPLAKERGLALEKDVPPNVRIITDRRRLLQCLINLLSNAVKFTERGEIHVSSREVDGALEISVSDTGIAQKDIPNLFEAFERLDSHLRIKTGGTGLGLYLTRKLATNVLRGEVSVRSREGVGSTFTLKIAKDLRQDYGVQK